MVGAQDDEARLVEEAREGDREAFDRLVRAHFGRIYGVLSRMVGNHEDAEDLAQETFVRAFRSLSFYKGEGAFGAWLMRIGLHLAQDHFRRKGRSEVVALEGIEREPESRPASGPVGELTQRELALGISEAIDQLPHNLRAALVLRVLEGMEYEDIARATGMKPGTVRTQVMKARKMLLRLMGPMLERSKK